MTEEQQENGGFVERLRNSPRTVSTIIVILIIAGAVFAFSDKNQEQNSPTPEPTPEATEESKAEATPENGKVKEEKDQKATPAPTPLPQAKETGEAYVEVAQRGQGVTHLARQAVKRHVAANESAKDLSNEQKVFVEDYLKDLNKTKRVAVGQEVTFSKDEIGKAVEESRKLSDAQIKNLQKYARNVNWN